MKDILRILLLTMMVCCWSCSGGEDDPINPTPKPEEKPKIEVTTTAPVLAQEGGTASVTFTSSADWTIDVTEGRAVSWCTVSPTSGSKGTNTLTVTTTSNDTYDERNAKVTIKAGATSQSFTVTQKQKNGLTVTSNKVEIGSDGGNFSIEAKANVSVTYEIEEAAKNWISASESRGLTSKTLNFTAKANEEEEHREGKIVLKGADGLTETVTVYQEGEKPTLVITSDDVIVGSDGETIKIELKSNVNYTIVLPNVDWISQAESRAISVYTHYLNIAPNESYDQRSAMVYFNNETEGLNDSISITQLQLDAIIVAKNEYEVAPEGTQLEFKVSSNVDFEVSTSVDWIKQNTSSRSLVEKALSFTIEENEAKESRSGEIIITYSELKQTIKVNQPGAPDYEAIERAALIDLYNATGGDNWDDKTNWCSDRPLDEWYGIECEDGRVVEIVLAGNNLIGNIPESFVVFLDKAKRIFLCHNGLHGSIPAVIKEHEKWQEWGWDIIYQHKKHSPLAGFDISQTNLHLPDTDLTLFGGEIINSIEQARKHKLTTVIAESPQKPFFPLMSDKLVNLHLDYQNKGLLTLVSFINTYTEESLQEWGWEETVEDLPTVGFEIVLESDNLFLRTREDASPEGTIAVFDENGDLVAYLNDQDYIYKAQNFVNSGEAVDLMLADLDSIYRMYLGEPEEHPIYSSNLYTSTDYSKDGEVVTLQKATVGQGIDLVFMGDAFVDRDMEEGGEYEKVIKRFVEDFFSFEPYQTFRNRFNVFMVKVVSPNEVYGGQNRLVNDALCFEYATKVPGIDKKKLRITILVNKKFHSGHSHCDMYADGSFISIIYTYIVFDKADSVENRARLGHESGGHGFGQLLDEYWYEDYEFKDEWRNDLDASYDMYGIGANLDWRTDPETVRWSHFIKDERYSEEGIGVFEGAYGYGKNIYRSTEHSIMRNHAETPYFNAPSREHIYKKIMQESEGENWKYDYEEFVKFDEKSRNAASRAVFKPLTEEEQKEYIKNHRPPRFIKGTWRDVIKNGKNNIVVPYR